MFTKLAFTALALTAVGAISSAQAARQDFTLVNDGHSTIREARLSPAWSPYVGGDALRYSVLAPGASTRIYFPSNSSDCLWDLTLVYANGQRSEGRHNLCRVQYVHAL
jgi:hypothetical protein